MGKAGLPTHLVWGAVGLARGRLLGHAVCHLVALNARVRRDPQDEDLVAALNQPGGRLDDGSCPLLPKAIVCEGLRRANAAESDRAQEDCGERAVWVTVWDGGEE